MNKFIFWIRTLFNRGKVYDERTDAFWHGEPPHELAALEIGEDQEEWDHCD